MFTKCRITGISNISAHKGREEMLTGREMVVKSFDIDDNGLFIGELQFPIGEDPLDCWHGGVTYIKGAYVKEI